ncbi:hypothetical protein O181_037377 [Austropuccinia psidii MF-1]|uniref:Integrase catalytic domain-containing protein n=1 Tax=Austropuccinia psidii MF-1 TaxID=1389203 RepID=A0A9Q3D8W1_9BASI|nr:hypothetical protein [Austropuccinia psidii MF-1]
MDFITQLPFSNTFASILVVVYIFLKIEIIITTYSKITALDVSKIFISHVFSKHGLTVSIPGDKGSLFASSSWTQLFQQLMIERDLSTALHPKTDEKTERSSHILQQYLWMYVSDHQVDWKIWLPLAKFAYNNAELESTEQSPSFTIYGRNKIFYFIHITQDKPAVKLSTELQ